MNYREIECYNCNKLGTIHKYDSIITTTEYGFSLDIDSGEVSIDYDEVVNESVCSVGWACNYKCNSCGLDINLGKLAEYNYDLYVMRLSGICCE